MHILWNFIQRLLSAVGLLFLSPVLVPVLILVWAQDGHSPFYVAQRTGKNSVKFKMIKIRSMVVNADKTGVDSTANNDQRITAVGGFVRKYKLDEFVQLFNVLVGDMSLVGPRPNVPRETDLYTPEEQQLLTVKPGITDFASIVFADEGDILEGSEDADISYHQLIRPGKSRLGLFYLKNTNPIVDIKIVFLTVLAVVCRDCALRSVSEVLKKMGADSSLVLLASRTDPLVPSPPPGAASLVVSRDGRVDV